MISRDLESLTSLKGPPRDMRVPGILIGIALLWFLAMLFVWTQSRRLSDLRDERDMLVVERLGGTTGKQVDQLRQRIRVLDAERAELAARVAKLTQERAGLISEVNETLRSLSQVPSFHESEERPAVRTEDRSLPPAVP